MHEGRARRHAREGQSHTEPAVIVTMHPDLFRAELTHRMAHDGLEFIDQRSAVRVTERKIARTAAHRRRQRADRILGIGLVAVEKVLRIVDHLAALRDEVARRVFDHREVFFERGPEDLGHVERPRFPDDRHHRHSAVEEGAQLRIFVGLRARAPGRTKRRQPRVL